MNYTQYIENRLQQGVDFSISRAISEGFSYLGKNTGQYILFTLVYGLVMIGASMFANFIPFEIGTYIIKAVLSPALAIGYATYCRQQVVHGTAEFGNFFDGFRNNYSQMVVANVLIMIIIGLSSALLLLPYTQELAATMQDIVANGGSPGEIFEEISAIFGKHVLPIFGYLVIALVVQVFYLQVNYFVVFYDFGFWEAMEASRILMSRVFFKAIGYLIVASLIFVFGTLFSLGIGALFLFPAIMLMSYSVFEQLAGFNALEPKLEDDLII